MGVCTASSQGAGTPQGTVSYPAKPSFLLKSPRGVTYRLSLIPDFDVGKHAGVLELVLQKPGKKVGDRNLLDWTGKLHGYQPYVFAASDFVGGIQKSIYGKSRVINLQKLGMEIYIKVVDVHIEPIPGSAAPRYDDYQFLDLTLEIATRNLSERNSNKSGQ